MLYLIDLQDEGKYGESIEYLGRIIKSMRNKNALPSTKINICFSNEEEYESLKTQLKKADSFPEKFKILDDIWKNSKY